jgi:hypothetical protein
MTGVPPARRVIRLFPDYSRDWPLWEDSTPTLDVGYTTTPADYDLSAALASEMATWNTFWERHFHHDGGWDTDESREQWRLDGERIASRLRAEVASYADVQYEPWPIEAGPDS